jgi:hypothetical protein
VRVHAMEAVMACWELEQTLQSLTGSWSFLVSDVWEENCLAAPFWSLLYVQQSTYICYVFRSKAFTRLYWKLIFAMFHRFVHMVLEGKPSYWNFSPQITNWPLPQCFFPLEIDQITILLLVLLDTKTDQPTPTCLGQKAMLLLLYC